MFAKKLHGHIRSLVIVLEKFVDRWWYPPVVGLLAAVDMFVIIVPTDGILISSSMIAPRRWLSLALCVALGSTLGALLLAALVHRLGLPWILDLFPGVQHSRSWSWTVEFFDAYGLGIVFVVALLPLMQQPAILLAAVAGNSLWALAAVVAGGRLIKYLLMAYLGSHAPRLLNKFWGVKEELAETGITLDKP
jgi:membrane protein YqaA with SNARE-associated domain